LSARALALGAGATLALGAAAEWIALYRPSFALPATAAERRLAVADFAAGGALVCGGAVCLWKARTPVIGALLAVAGVAWFAGSLAPSGLAGPAGVGAYLVALHRAPLVHALLAFPRGALRSTLDRASVIAMYAVSLVGALGQTAVARLGVAAVLLAGAPMLRRTATARVAALAFALVIAAGALADLAGASPATARSVGWAYDVTVAAVAIGLTTAATTSAAVGAAVTRIVVELGDAPDASLLAGRLGRAVGDRSLALGFWSEDARAFVDASGAQVRVDGMTTTEVHDGRSVVAVIVHDPATFEDGDVRAAAVEAVRVAVANTRLQRAIARQADELRASRRRLVVAADRQRELLERDLERRTEHHLARLQELLTGADRDGADAELLAETLEELAAARIELTELAQGLRPRLLGELGLAAALSELARRAPVPVAVDVLRERLPAEVEAAAYFVVAESLANVAKHADAASAAVAVSRAGEILRVAVRDDGRGGAAPAAGSGLRGLADRVEALGGRLTVVSAAGTGTTVTAALPL
jgi:signal transduction histidine kinase